MRIHHIVPLFLIIFLLSGCKGSYLAEHNYKNTKTCSKECLSQGYEEGKCEWPTIMNKTWWDHPGKTYPISELKKIGYCYEGDIFVTSRHCPKKGSCGCFCYNTIKNLTKVCWQKDENTCCLGQKCSSRQVDCAQGYTFKSFGCNDNCQPLVSCEETGPNTYTTGECEQAEGTVLGDPGDGSLHREGCPEGQEKLGFVVLGDEGGICCK